MTPDTQPIDLHAIYRMQSQAGYTHGVYLHAHQVQDMASRLRSISAISAVLVAGCDPEMFKMSGWMQGGLFEAIHVIASDAQAAIERAHDSAVKEQGK